MKLKYVGLKVNGCTAYARESGIARWFPGDIHEVPDAAVKRMLQHPDIFALASPQAAKPAPAPVAPPAPAAPATAPAPSPAVDPSTLTLAPGATVASAPVAPPASPVFEIAGRDGPVVLDGMDRDALHKLAKKLKVKVHPNAGAETVSKALVKALPVQK